MTNIKLERWQKVLFYFWAYTLIVILWGAWVRISHSGNGCGNHWPLCEGAFIPTGGNQKTWTEYAHRLMSGSYGVFVIYLFFKLRTFNLGNSFKKLNLSLLILMISEALIGALLVKGQLVTENDSILRLIVMSFHQLNSFLLTGVTFLIYLFIKAKNSAVEQKNMPLLFLFLILPITGAVASLSTTLFPSISLWQGILEDFSGGTHLFVRLRILHPVLALIIASGLAYFLYLKNHSRLALEFLIAIAVGILTLLTLSPGYLKLTHLFIAHFLWSRLIQIFVSFPDSRSR